MRSTFDILQDLSEAWEGLTSVEKQELAETVAGKTQRSLFTAIMTNFESAVGATEAALESEGSAAAENEKRMESLQGKVQQLESAWQSFARNTINSDFVKNILSAVTGLIKFADAAGGLVPILTTLVSLLAVFKAGSLAKGIVDISKKFSDFSKTISTLGGGLKGFQLALAGVKTAEDAAKVSTLGLATAAQTLTTALGIIGIVLGIATTAYNLFTNSQKEASAAAVESSKTADEEIQNQEKKIKTTEDEVNKLKEERDALLEVASAGGEDAQSSRNLAQDKQKEIDKRQENINKIKDENAELLRQREASVVSMKPNKADFSVLGFGNVWDNLKDKSGGYRKTIIKLNGQLQEADRNTGVYKRTLEELIQTYEKQFQQKAANNKSTERETSIIRELNKELEDNAEKYEEDAKVAEELYDIMVDGGDISQKTLENGENALEWLQDFLDLTDEQVEQLKNHIDVLSEETEATQNYIDAVGGLTEAQKDMQDNLIYTDEKLQKINEDIDNTQSAYATLTSAVDEYNSSGGISMDTLQQLLSLDGEYLNSLELVNGKLQISKAVQDEHSKAMETNTLALIENAAMEDLMAMATEGAGNIASTASSKIYATGENAKKAGEYASEGAKGFVELAGAMAEAGMIDPSSGVDTEAWANKWAGITEKIKGLTSTSGGGGVTSSKFTGSSGGSSGRKSSGGSGKKSGSSSTKSAKEEYKPEVDALYWYKNALDNAEESVDKLNDALKNTDNFNEQEKYLNQLIDATNNQINKTNELKNAQVGQINDFINQLRQQGFAIDYNSQNNELYINNMQHLADFTGDAAKNVEDLLDKIQDLNDDNRDLDSSVRDLTADVKDYYEQLADIPEQKLEKFNELMEDFQQSRLDQIQYQIEDLEHEMENDPRLQALEEQIAALEKQNDEIDKQQEMEEKLLAVEEAKLKLQNAQQQKTLQVYREGQGFVWEADPDAIKEAQEELEDAQKDLNEQIKDDQLEQLEEEKEAIEKSYQDRIDALQNFLDEQEYLIDKANREGIQTFEELRNELAKYGLDSAEYLGKATDWLNNYNSALANLNNTVQGILASSGDATSELIYSSAMQSRINQALSNALPEVATNSSMFGSGINYDKVSSSSSQTVYINTVELPNVQDSEDFISELKNLPRMATSQSALRQ